MQNLKTLGRGLMTMPTSHTVNEGAQPCPAVIGPAKMYQCPVMLTNVWFGVRQVGCREVAVSCTAVVTCVQGTHASNLHHEHGCPQNMASPVSTNLMPRTQSIATPAACFCPEAVPLTTCRARIQHKWHSTNMPL